LGHNCELEDVVSFCVFSHSGKDGDKEGQRGENTKLFRRERLGEMDADWTGGIYLYGEGPRKVT